MRGYRSNVSGLYGWNVYSPVRGLSVVLSTVTRWLEVFPRMRGLSEVFDLIQKGTDVFPACGVIGHPHGYLCTVLVFPRMRGYRLEKQNPTEAGVFPRVRGLSVTFWQLVKHFCVFPACGVNGENGNLHKNVFCIPPCAGLSAEIE